MVRTEKPQGGEASTQGWGERGKGGKLFICVCYSTIGSLVTVGRAYGIIILQDLNAVGYMNNRLWYSSSKRFKRVEPLRTLARYALLMLYRSSKRFGKVEPHKTLG